MASDDSYSAVVSQLIKVASSDTAKGVELFERRLPGLAAQIRDDARPRGPIGFWGRCSNVDEVADDVIVAPSIMQVIGLLAGRRMSATAPHAGLQHTYGYLFSLLETPWGLKRERWLETEIERAFGLNSSTLSPAPESGTLLANATWLAGLFAFRGNRNVVSRMKSYLVDRVADDVGRVRVRDVRHTRLTEVVSTHWFGKQRRVRLQTDLIQSPVVRSLYLLVYSLRDESSGSHKLVTMFPTGSDMYRSLLAYGRSARQSEIRLRYNAWLPCLNGKLFSGRCQLKTF